MIQIELVARFAESLQPNPNQADNYLFCGVYSPSFTKYARYRNAEIEKWSLLVGENKKYPLPIPAFKYLKLNSQSAFSPLFPLVF